MSILIQGGTIVDPSQGLEKKADLLIEDGKVSRVGKVAAKKSWEVLDAGGLIVTPGLIDMHVHLREPGQEYKETIETGVSAAVAGGFTSVACMANTEPVNDCEAVTRYIIGKARALGLANVFPIGAVTKGSRGVELAEIGEMLNAGAVGISDDGHPVQNSQIMRRAMEYARIFDCPVLDHCEDLHLSADGLMNESAISTELGLRGLSGTAEESQVARDVVLSRLTGAKVHICHVSVKGALDWVRLGKSEGIRVTCEVAPHHFLLSDEAVRSFDTNLKMKPPLRTRSDVEVMLQGLSDGTIDCIATDHAPHARVDKEVTFEEAANGIIGMETSVPLVWEHLVHRDVISVSRAVELMSLNPARILSLEGRGTLAEGSIGDVTLIDPDCKYRIDATRFRSKARNCPFHGWEVRGAVAGTLVEGRLVYRRNGNS